MKKVFLMLLVAMPLSLMAQKFGHFNAGEIMEAMPETATMRSELQALDRQIYILQTDRDELQKKYDELIDFYKETFYPFSDYYKNEQYKHTRTPNLSSDSTSTGTGSATSKHNETRTTKITPTNYQTETTHKVDPFDSSGLRNQSQDISVVPSFLMFTSFASSM